MIFGHVSQPEAAYAAMPAALQVAVKHLRDTDIAALPAGNYDLQGKDIYVQVIDTTTRPVAQNRPEVHRKYIDVQFLCAGRERIGVTNDTGGYTVDKDMLAERDLLFYDDVRDETFLEMHPGNFAVFFPWDAHRPACEAGAPSAIRKVVVKVAVALLADGAAR